MYAVARLPAMRPESAGPAGSRLRATAEGLRFIRRRPVLVAAFLTDLNAMLLWAACGAVAPTLAPADSQR